MSVTLSDNRYEELREAEQERDSLRKELESFKTEFGNYREAVSKKFDSVKNEIQQVRESESSDHNPKGENDETTTQNGETTLERIADDNQDDPAGVQIGPSVDRAAAVMRNWEHWSNKAPKGRNIREGLKTLLETATGETLAWRQVYRACKKIEQLTKGKIVFTKTNKHGWMLLQPNERASSAGSG